MPLDVAGPTIGDTAPDFSLTAAGGEELALKKLRGQKVLLVFYRGAW